MNSIFIILYVLHFVSILYIIVQNRCFFTVIYPLQNLTFPFWMRVNEEKEKSKIPRTFVLGIFGIPTARGYNAPCFEHMVHYFMGSVLMRWDNEDRKDRLSIALAIQNETKHFQVVSSNFQVQY